MGWLPGPGGWDYLLSATFWAFVIVCPLLRGATLLLLLLAPLPLRAARALFAASRAISYYYAHEVMLVGVPLLQITVGPLTSTLFTPRVTHICGPLDEQYDQSSCFAIRVQPGAGYVATCAAVVVFLLTGFDGSPTHKALHCELHPEGDEPPPTCGRGARARAAT